MRGDSGSTGDTGLIEIVTAKDVSLPLRKERSSEGDMIYSTNAFSNWLKSYTGRVFMLEDGSEVRIERENKRTSRGYKWKLVLLNRNLVSNVKT
jgi:hypothetical protein